MSEKSPLDFHSNIPIEIKEDTVKALAFFPELKQVKIEFVFNENIRKSVMQAQPKFLTMFATRKRRSYIIKVSRHFSLNGQKIPIQDLPEKVLTGWIGHELGHIMDYRSQSNWSLIYFGLSYLFSKKFFMQAERTADTYAVNHGMGAYILATKDFILHQAGMPEKYIRRINKLYLPPQEIIELMEKIPVVSKVK